MTFNVFVPAPGAQDHLAGLVTRFFDTELGPAIRDEIRANIAVLTGRLRASESFDVQMYGHMPVLRIGSTDVDYSVYVELGTSRMAARPVMQAALYRRRG